MDSLNLAAWVNTATSITEKEFRQAIHTLVLAISKSRLLQTKMVVHGGILLAIRFNGIRHTKDIDFVTSEQYSEYNEKDILKHIDESLTLACESLNYGLDCRIQSHRLNPPGKDRSFQTMQINMGYAYTGTEKHKRLLRNQCPDILEIDYSFNETNQHIDTLQVVDGGKIKAYSISDLMAEKYRTIIQQTIRNRNRRQDVFDIYWLLKNNFLEDDNLKKTVYESLIIKARTRGIILKRYALRNKETINRSSSEYHLLAQEISGDLPPFEVIYKKVRIYYEALPWVIQGT